MDTLDTALDTAGLDNSHSQHKYISVNVNKLSLQSIQNKDKDTRHATPIQKTIAACSGASFTALFTTPFDVVKTRLQSQGVLKKPPLINSKLYPASLTTCCEEVVFSTQNLRREFLCHLNSSHYSPSQSSTISCAVADAAALVPNRTNHHFNGTLDGVIKIVRNEGVTSLWRGLSPALVMSIPVTVIYFVGYDHLRDSLWANWKGKHSETFSPLIAGATARTIAATVISPLELFRTRMQGPEGVNGLKKVMKGVYKMAKINGVSSLWRGLEPTLYRDVPFSAIYWTGYELTKRYLNNYMRENSDRSANDFVVAFLSGAASGSVAAVLTTPFDVAKTRRQVALTQTKTPSISKVLKQIFQEEGYKGLFRGGILRVSKVAVSCAIMISTYETLSKMV